MLQEKQNPFIEEFVKYGGYPVWNRGIIKLKKTETADLLRVSESEEKVIFIPVMSGTDSIVNAILKVQINGNDTSLNMLYRWQYNKEGYGKTDTTNNAEQTALLFMALESYTLGHKHFKINDELMFGKEKDRVQRYISIKGINESQANSRMSLTSLSICYEVKVDPFDADCPPLGGGGAPTQIVCENFNY